MAAYATSRLELASTSFDCERDRAGLTGSSNSIDAGSLLEALVDQLAERVAERIAAADSALSSRNADGEDEWFDSRHAAGYLGIHRDTLRKLAAERAIPSEQDGPNCKLYFRRSDLDAWRRTGGRPRHLAAVLRDAA